MRTLIQGPLVRSVGPNSFRDITTAPVISLAGGVTFDGDLTDTEADAVWWRITSRDDDDQAKRQAIAALIAEAEAGTHGASWLNDAFATLGRYVIGLPE